GRVMVGSGREGPRGVHFSIPPPYGAATPAADMLAWARTMLFAAGRPAAESQDLMALPDGLRSVVTDCLAPDPAGRPLARAVLTEPLSGQDLPARRLAP